MIAADALVKEYGDVRAVNDVSLSVAPGEIVLVMGPNGSGKTTLLSMLGGLVRPTRGTVSIEGRKLTDLTPRELAAFRLRRVGFVFQSFRLLDALNARENVQLVIDLAGGDRKRADALLERMGALPLAKRNVRALSGGEKQRIAIARALANEPAVLLADEPTGSLDSAAGEATIALLAAAAHRDRRAVVIVSHDPRIVPYADRVVTMTDGSLLNVAR